MLAALVACAGCGPESHEPRVHCTNFGTQNVRRNIRLRLSVSVDRPPLRGVSTETVKLFALPENEPVPGEVIYGGERILFSPAEPLADSSHYRIEVLDGIEDASGKKLAPWEAEFWTGKTLQVYWVDLLRSYDSQLGEVNSIGIYFSEGVNESMLIWSEGYITVYDSSGFPHDFAVTYYEDVALAVLSFYTPLVVGEGYTLRVGPYIASLDGEWLDGDRDGYTADFEPFVMSFKYAQDLVYGIVVADSSTNAEPYYEPTERCFLYEFD